MELRKAQDNGKKPQEDIEILDEIALKELKNKMQEPYNRHARKKRVNQSPQITIKQLKELIKDLPDDMLIMTEGCDCYGDANGIIVKDNECLITRIGE